MSTLRKLPPTTRYHLPEGTRRELRGQVIQWRDDAAKRRRRDFRQAEITEQLLPRAVPERNEKRAIAVLGGAAVLVFVLRMAGVL